MTGKVVGCAPFLVAALTAVLWLAGSDALAASVTVYYNPIVVTKITYENPDGDVVEHYPADVGVFKVDMKPGPGALSYRIGEPYPARYRTDKWHGVRFTVTDEGLEDFGRSWRDKKNKPLPKGELRLVGKSVVCIGVDPPKPRTGSLKLSHHPQLLMDDFVIAKMQGLRRKMQPPTKYAGNPIIPYEYPWEQARIWFVSVIYDEAVGKFRMWYKTWAKYPCGSHPSKVCYAESDDGFRWAKPMSDDVPYEGKTPTNIVEGVWAMIKTPHDPKRPYKGLAKGMTAVHSKDGMRWTKAARTTTTKCDNYPSLVWYGPIGKYLIFTRAQCPVKYARTTGIMESADFADWSPKKMLVLHKVPYIQFHSTFVTVYGDLLIGMPAVLHMEEVVRNKLGKKCTELMCSRNGWKWTRIEPGTNYIDNGPEVWDRGQTHVFSMARKDDTVYIFYGGFARKHGEGGEGKPHRCQIGVATLPADRFVALRPESADREGVLQTKVFTASGRELLINAELADKADLKVELLDERGGVLSGFDQSHSRLTAADKLRYRVVWGPAGEERTLPSGRPVAMRLILRRGALYAFQIPRQSREDR